MKILLVEDDQMVADSLALALRGSGYLVEHFSDGIEAETAAYSAPYDVIILDLGLPGIDGLQFLERIRNKKVTSPVLILTARDSYEDRIKGLDVGANDYVVKPFHLGELEARVRALLRVTSGNVTTIEFGQLSFDTVRRIFRQGENVIELSPREASVLEILVRNLGVPVTKQNIAQALSELDSTASYNSIDIAVHRLRKKLEPFGLKLQTVWGVGFLVEP